MLCTWVAMPDEGTLQFWWLETSETLKARISITTGKLYSFIISTEVTIEEHQSLHKKLIENLNFAFNDNLRLFIYFRLTVKIGHVSLKILNVLFTYVYM